MNFSVPPSAALSSAFGSSAGLAFGNPQRSGYLAIALIVFPKIYRYSRNVLAKAYALPHITAARAADSARFASWLGMCFPSPVRR